MSWVHLPVTLLKFYVGNFFFLSVLVVWVVMPLRLMGSYQRFLSIFGDGHNSATPQSRQSPLWEIHVPTVSIGEFPFEWWTETGLPFPVPIGCPWNPLLKILDNCKISQRHFNPRDQPYLFCNIVFINLISLKCIVRPPLCLSAHMSSSIIS
jgi:hypothetical protein